MRVFRVIFTIGNRDTSLSIFFVKTVPLRINISVATPLVVLKVGEFSMLLVLLLKQ